MTQKKASTCALGMYLFLALFSNSNDAFNLNSLGNDHRLPILDSKSNSNKEINSQNDENKEEVIKTREDYIITPHGRDVNFSSGEGEEIIKTIGSTTKMTTSQKSLSSLLLAHKMKKLYSDINSKRIKDSLNSQEALASYVDTTEDTDRQGYWVYGNKPIIYEHQSEADTNIPIDSVQEWVKNSKLETKDDVDKLLMKFLRHNYKPIENVVGENLLGIILAKVATNYKKDDSSSSNISRNPNRKYKQAKLKKRFSKEVGSKIHYVSAVHKANRMKRNVYSLLGPDFMKRYQLGSEKDIQRLLQALATIRDFLDREKAVEREKAAAADAAREREREEAIRLEEEERERLAELERKEQEVAASRHRLRPLGVRVGGNDNFMPFPLKHSKSALQREEEEVERQELVNRMREDRYEEEERRLANGIADDIIEDGVISLGPTHDISISDTTSGIKQQEVERPYNRHPHDPRNKHNKHLSNNNHHNPTFEDIGRSNSRGGKFNDNSGADRYQLGLLEGGGNDIQYDDDNNLRHNDSGYDDMEEGRINLTDDDQKDGDEFVPQFNPTGW